jgi:uncharacterized protein YndB with AHSA1/START domain
MYSTSSTIRIPSMTTNNAVEITTPTDREVMITRTFGAPSRLVFDAMTKPELLRRWYGPSGWSLVVCDVDLRVGGRWRFVSRRPDGKEIGQKGVYHEIVPGRRLVNTESWEDWDPGETLVTSLFTEKDEKTTLTSTILFPSREARDIVVEAGLKHGLEDHYGKLAALLASELEHAGPAPVD